MATAAQKHRKLRRRRAHQEQTDRRNREQGFTGGPNTGKKSAGHPVGLRTPSHHKTDPPRFGAQFKTTSKPVVIPADPNRSQTAGPHKHTPTDDQWEKIVARSKTRKRSIKALAERSGWEPIGEDPKQQQSWAVAA